MMMSILRWFSIFCGGVFTVYMLCFAYVIFPCVVGAEKWKSIGRYLALVCVAICIWIGAGIWYVYFVPEKRIGKTVRVVDAMIDQNMINDYYSYGGGAIGYVKNFVTEKYERAVKVDGWDKVDLFVLPESSAMYDLTNNAVFERRYANMNNEKSALIAGFNRYSDIDLVTGGFDVFNSIGVVDSNGVHGTYDKMHLVPFGEFVPFRNVLKMAKFTAGGQDFSAGDRRGVIVAGGLRLYPLLCYEAIFETDVPDGVDAIVTISNDAWFGEWGKVQHLEMAKFRAVQAGVPLILATNMGAKGRSGAVVDEKGRLLPWVRRNDGSWSVVDFSI